VVPGYALPAPAAPPAYTNLLHPPAAQRCAGPNDTVRKEVWLTLELDEYREAEADLVRYLTERDRKEAAARVGSVEGLAKLTHLRRLVGQAKIWAARRWIDNFFESNPDRSLVSYAYHKDVQQALVDHDKCAHILGGEHDVEEQKRQFQSGESKLIVCSSGPAREGHTLTRAADVVLVEPRWVPMDQEEGRVNRIGQTADITYAWYLLGADTVDERVWKIIEAKAHSLPGGCRGQGRSRSRTSGGSPTPRQLPQRQTNNTSTCH
jgi:hypothetical protein